MRFDELDLEDAVLDGLYDMNFEETTPVQALTIPIILEGKDIIACAQTGTGKTAAYVLPIISELSRYSFPKDAVNAVIMAPTRELAQQIDQQIQGFTYFIPGISAVAVYGGTDGITWEQQKRGMELGADIVIATPGRLLSHIKLGTVDLSKVSFFVLDEADRMLDMGFYDDIMQVYKQLPANCQTIMFSATMPPKIQQMANKILKDPVEIKIAVSKPAEKIKQSAYICYETQKIPILKHIFKETPPHRVIVFSSSKLKVKTLARELRKLNFKIGEMHSDLDQTQRDNVMLDFKSGKINVIVATDILSRGIDIDDIEMVVNFDVPREAEDYVHRIGRTARADRDGRAVTFVAPDDMIRLRKIERLLEKEVPKAEVSAALGETPQYNSDSARGQKGRGRQSGSRRKPRRTEGQKQAGSSNNKKQKPAGDLRPAEAQKPTGGQNADGKQKEGSARRHGRRRNRGHRKAGSESSANSSTSSAESTK